MEQIYFVCAIVGGTIFVCQFVLALFGLGGHHDFGGHDVALHDVSGHDAGGTHTAGGHDSAADHESQSAWFVGLFTFRTLLAAVTFFGFGGMAAVTSKVPPLTAFVVAFASGGGALYAVAWLMRTLYGLKDDGTVRIERALGQTGTVYLAIPGGNSGVGKVTVTVQERTMEYQAVTAGHDLPTGAAVTIVSIHDPDTVEVALTPHTERYTHV